MKRLTKATAITVAVAAAFIVAPMNANAAEYGCSGRLIDTYKVKSQVPNHLSTIRLYYDSATGYNCAVNVKTAYYSQFKHQASIWLYNSDWAEDNHRPGVNTDEDNGDYKYYAGPVKVKGKGKCIGVVARTWYYDEVGIGSGSGHCG